MSQASCGSSVVGLGVVRDPGQQVRGTIEALLVDPPGRTIHAMIVRSTDPVRRGCYLLPIDGLLARFDERTGCLEVEVEEVGPGSWTDRQIDPEEVMPFTDDDWVNCLFRRAQ